ncbi:MAG: response regulator [Pseudomonadota bacterium]
MAAPRKVLLIEDSEDDQYITTYLLRKHWPDVEIVTAWNGEVALDALEAMAGVPPDLILLDINMPRMNGHEFLAEWCGVLGNTVPAVVMLSSSEQTRDIGLSAGYEAVRQYFVKPMRAEYLDTIDAMLL